MRAPDPQDLGHAFPSRSLSFTVIASAAKQSRAKCATPREIALSLRSSQ
jgi:hypothetical protein